MSKTVINNKKKMHKLQYSYTIYEQRVDKTKDWDDNCIPICTFDTVESFWQYFTHLPLPSQIFFDGISYKQYSDNRIVSAYSMFRDNIAPKREDPANTNGTLWRVQLKEGNIMLYNDMWTNVVMAVVGNMIEDVDVTGIRIVDKSKHNIPKYMLEIWTAPGPFVDIHETLISIIQDGIDSQLDLNITNRRNSTY